jgi:hypothetical protein
LPVPDSPSTSTLESNGATWRINAFTRTIGAELPTNREPPACPPSKRA